MIQLMVFDKTGTLTEDGLQILGVRGVDGALSGQESESLRFSAFVESIKDLLPKEEQDDSRSLRSV